MNTFTKTASSDIEPLEARIAPAAVFTYTDVDGDKVTIKTSQGSNAELADAIHLLDVTPGRQQLITLDLSSSASFDGTDVIISAKRAPGGDGQVNVGYIDATGMNTGTSLDLGKVVVKGDLGRIEAGDSNGLAPAIASLSVQSFGTLGQATQDAAGDLHSEIAGDLGK